MTIARKRSLNRLLGPLEGVLFLCALTLFGYCGYVSAESWLFQNHEASRLDRLLLQRQEIMQDDGGGAHPFSTPSVNQVSLDEDDGLIGRIAISRLGVSAMIMEGTDSTTLRHSAGHIPGTGLPGLPGNIAIAAHRDTFFRPLKDVRPDDIITVTTAFGIFRYKVISTEVVNPDDTSVLEPNDDEVLTLVTCYPFEFVGNAPSRFIVRAERVAPSGS